MISVGGAVDSCKNIHKAYDILEFLENPLPQRKIEDAYEGVVHCPPFMLPRKTKARKDPFSIHLQSGK